MTPEIDPPVLRIAAAMRVRADGRTLLVRKRHTTIFMQQGGKIDSGEAHFAAAPHPKRKRTNSRWPSMGINYLLRTDPILTTPGGWGLRNPEPKGPGQRRSILSQSSTAGAGRKWGGIMIPLTIP
jgi:hypothetical protein